MQNNKNRGFDLREYILSAKVANRRNADEYRGSSNEDTVYLLAWKIINLVSKWAKWKRRLNRGRKCPKMQAIDGMIMQRSSRTDIEKWRESVWWDVRRPLFRRRKTPKINFHGS